jgi:hypothetical protein
VDGEVLLAFAVDISELVFAERVALLRAEIAHQGSPSVSAPPHMAYGVPDEHR